YRSGVSLRRSLHPRTVGGRRGLNRVDHPRVRRRVLYERRADRSERFRSKLLPNDRRATGVSWMLGIGRFGSIVGSLVGGALLGLGWGFGAILGILAIPALYAAIAIASTRRAAG